MTGYFFVLTYTANQGIFCMNKRFVSAIYEFALGPTLTGKRVCQCINLQISPFFVVVVENKKKQSQDAAFVIKHTCFLYSFVVCILRICKS